MNKFYHIHTYGCQMNVHESEKLAGALRDRGYASTDDVADADIIVMNTCCVRGTAESKVYGHLGRLKSQKKRGAVLVVCGCMTQQPNVANELAKRCPFVDIVLGTFNQYLLGEYIDNFLHTGVKTVDVWESQRDENCEGAAPYRTSGINAWVNIMYGCNNFCTYCIVPYVRGRERSRPIDDILGEVDDLLKSGYKQITLLGQNVNSYAYKDKRFIDLLRMLDCDRKYRLKFMTSHPKDISPELASLYAQSKVLGKSLHLPVQAGSDRILEAMNRHYTHDEYLDKIAAFREQIPDIGLSSDVMVGFPTETEDDFMQTLDLVERVRYNNLFMFIYSRRSGTPADKMEQLDYKTKQARIDRLIKAQFEISKSLASETVGNTYEVLVSDKTDGHCYGKTQYDAAVSFDSDAVEVGDFVNVKIISAKNANLRGEVVL
ncbi:MAG: tRNA (N6-isopentenyl adenosine(37)-C2)-methylthiotransferase MiaB [Clostridia bacterium]|nr:tRNA (N6-isopentenyl adenosine(37)-C2)-methylthiotransferase MiaB [Clostridia bacterium]